jgi:hypothetical protein
MKLTFGTTSTYIGLVLAALVPAIPALAQYPPPGQYGQQGDAPVGDLDQLVQRVALYPDPLLAQVLTASTYWDEIPQAASWANAHSYLNGPQLAAAMNQDDVSWDPSVMAMVPFPSVLNMMAQDPGWTQALGNAVLQNRAAVMDAVQRERQVAMQYGYLQSNDYDRVVNQGGYIEILPVNQGLIYVPSYQPGMVFARPRNRGFVGGAIRFGNGISIGAAFAPFGWQEPRFGWGEHNIIVGGHAWDRNEHNREHYSHQYQQPYHRAEGGHFQEHHEHDRGYREHSADRQEHENRNGHQGGHHGDQHHDEHENDHQH